MQIATRAFVPFVANLSYFSLEFAFGDMTMAEAARSAGLFATEVMPWFAQ